MRECTWVVFLLTAAAAMGQVAGPSVNMVTGTSWPDGDPFLQRQNEPSMAVSSRNVLHLLAGANDYRTVDLPGIDVNEPTGDAWLGVFKSFDGGQTWKSTLLPGYPQDTSATGMASPLKGMSAGADPVVRGGTNGLFYFGGLAFARGDDGESRIFVARFIDDNSASGGDTIRYLSTSILKVGDGDHFEDKPSLAADIPRGGAGACTIPGNPAQSFPGGRVYAAWTEFLGGAESADSRILFSHSEDCGATWSTPLQISGTAKTNQGAAIAINPSNGAIYVAWRVFAASQPIQSDAIVVAVSFDGGVTFPGPSTVAEIDPFDQNTTNYRFRTNAYPAIAIDGDASVPGGQALVYLAWAQRGTGPSGDARVMITASAGNRGKSWECLFASPVCVIDWAPAVAIENNTDRGHQFMPALTFSNGKLTAAWYDLRDTNKITTYTATGGGNYTEAVHYDGTPIFGTYIEDPKPGHVATARRYTLDVRLAQSSSRSVNPGFGPSVRVSHYAFGARASNPTLIQQLEVNPPNLPMFQRGTVPFFGDYIDLAGPVFIPNGDGTWRFNTLASDPEHIHAVWTDNRNVVQPRDGNWTSYTPVGLNSVRSIFDPSQTVGVCQVGQTGSRNQNIYTAQISQGLVVSAKSNNKPLGFDPAHPDQPIQRAFPVTVQNASSDTKHFHLKIPSQPPGGKATFVQFAASGSADPLTDLDITVPPSSSAARTVFMTSPNANASVEVDVMETGVANPLQSKVKLNADPSTPPSPNPNLPSTEIYNPDISNPDISNPDISNPDISNPDISNPDISNPDISNPDISNPDISNPAFRNPDISNPNVPNQGIPNVVVANPDISNPDISNPDISNPDISNPDISNPDISNPDISNSAITDATWAITNRGDTTANYSMKLLKNKLPPQGFITQLIISKRYNSPATDGTCTLKIQPHYVTLANIPDPVFTDSANLTTVDPQSTTPTVAVSPGERIQVTFRVVDNTTNDPLLARTHYNPGTEIVPVPVPDAKTGGPTAQPSLPLTVVTGALASGQVGQPYSQALSAAGGTAPYTWATLPNILPPGLTLNAAGTISGTPTGSGTITVSIQVTDSTGRSAVRSLALTVNAVAGGPTITTSTPVPAAVTGQPYSLTLAASGGQGNLTWTFPAGVLPDGLTPSNAGVLTGTPTPAAPGVFSFTVRVTDAAGNSDSKTLDLIVKAAPVLPVIGAVTSAAPGQPSVASGSWVTIWGTGLSDSTRSWLPADFQGTLLPTALDGVSVTIDGQPAAVSYVSPMQINVLSPVTGKTGTPEVKVTNSRGAASAKGAMATYAPAFFVIGGHYVAAVHADGVLVAGPDVFAGDVPARPAAPGENVEIYGTGFGPTVTPVDITKIFQGAVPLADPSQLHVTVGGRPANVTFAGVSSNGLYQFNVEIPNLFDGDYEVIAEIGGMKVPGGRMITVAAPSLQ